MQNTPNRVAVITGASEGIGRALAHQLSRDSHYDALVLTARSAERLESLADELSGDASTLCIAADLTDPARCDAVMQQAIAHFGRIDTLFNNAGATMWARFQDIVDVDVFRRIMDINYFGALHCTRAALPEIIRNKGRVVAVASVAGLTGVPCRTGYCASKHAVIGFFDALRIELRATGVSVTIVAPDFVVSNTHKRALSADGTALGASPMQESNIMSAKRCAQLIARAARKRKRLYITSTRGRLGRYVRLVFPALIDRIAARAIEQGR